MREHQIDDDLEREGVGAMRELVDDALDVTDVAAVAATGWDVLKARRRSMPICASRTLLAA
jgi:hypothetical protein